MTSEPGIRIVDVDADLKEHVFWMLPSYDDLVSAAGVCREWHAIVKPIMDKLREYARGIFGPVGEGWYTCDFDKHRFERDETRTTWYLLCSSDFSSAPFEVRMTWDRAYIETMLRERIEAYGGLVAEQNHQVGHPNRERMMHFKVTPQKLILMDLVGQFHSGINRENAAKVLGYLGPAIGHAGTWAVGVDGYDYDNDVFIPAARCMFDVFSNGADDDRRLVASVLVSWFENEYIAMALEYFEFARPLLEALDSTEVTKHAALDIVTIILKFPWHSLLKETMVDRGIIPRIIALLGANETQATRAKAAAALKMFVDGIADQGERVVESGGVLPLKNLMSGSCVKTKQIAASTLACMLGHGHIDAGHDTAELLERLVDFVLINSVADAAARFSVMGRFKYWNTTAIKALLKLLEEKVTTAGQATLDAAGFTLSWRAELEKNAAKRRRARSQ